MLELDHFVIASPDLDVGCHYIEKRFGVRPSMGGSHSGIGTRNALLGLADDVYIEVIAPDPEQIGQFPLKNYLANVSTPHLSWWAVRCSDITKVSPLLASIGVENDDARRWSRGTLSWQLLMPRSRKFAATLPFFIQWDDLNSHPAKKLEQAGRLVSCSIAHADAAAMQRALNETFSVSELPAVSLMATIDTPNGMVQLVTPTKIPPAIGSIR